MGEDLSTKPVEALDPFFSPQKHIREAILLFLAYVLGANFVLMWAAIQDHSWGALAIMVFLAPGANALLFFVGTWTARTLRRTVEPVSSRRYETVVLLAPAIGLLIDWGILSQVHLSGC